MLADFTIEQLETRLSRVEHMINTCTDEKSRPFLNNLYQEVFEALATKDMEN
jgi:hypothetical protein